ncbi:MAG: hypothetical protein RSF82_06915 [Angelakisella sp.]
MLSISVTGADNEEGLQELREFDKLLNKSFTITHKSSIKFTKIYYYKKNISILMVALLTGYLMKAIYCKQPLLLDLQCQYKTPHTHNNQI